MNVIHYASFDGNLELKSLGLVVFRQVDTQDHVMGAGVRTRLSFNDDASTRARVLNICKICHDILSVNDFKDIELLWAANIIARAISKRARVQLRDRVEEKVKVLLFRVLSNLVNHVRQLLRLDFSVDARIGDFQFGRL